MEAKNSMCGEKIPMLVLGKSNKPNCFKGIMSTLCRYRVQKTSWMDCKLFEEWVREQDRKFAFEGRKVPLVTDNCTSHPNIEDLKSITIYFLPPNTTSCLQFMNQGVIRSLKCRYRSRITNTIINAIDNGKQMPSISTLEAMKMFAHFWSDVSESTIINCFHKAGFKEGVADEYDHPFSAFKSLIDQWRQCDENLIPNDFTYKDISTVDNDIAVMGGVTIDYKILQVIIEVAEENVQEEGEVTDERITKPTTVEIRKAIDTLVDFSMFNPSGEIGTIASKAEKLFEKELCKSMKQIFISEFFEKK